MRIAVLGAGLQGACIALELARRGVRVELVEQDSVPLNRASLRNEGKIHLGFVYAKDSSFRTARTMLRGALTFRPLLSRWTAGAADRIEASVPFTYLVPKESFLSVRQLAAYYAGLQRLYEEELRTGEVDYLGARPARLWWTLPEEAYAPFAAADNLQGGFATMEASVSPEGTVAVLREALTAHPDIRLRTCHRVTDVTHGANGFRVEGHLPGGKAWRLECDQVVNALWDGRLTIDRQLGLEPSRHWVHRLKYRVIVELPERLRAMPSLTFALGAYGDVAVFGEAQACVTWYPQCMQGWSDDLEPPAEWHAACVGELPRPEQRAFGQQVLNAFDALVPGLGQARVLTVDAGVIFAWGNTDITDPASELHRRDEIGVQSVDGYHSVNTGKLTTAPILAVQAADRVVGRGVASPLESDDRLIRSGLLPAS